MRSSMMRTRSLLSLVSLLPSSSSSRRGVLGRGAVSFSVLSGNSTPAAAVRPKPVDEDPTDDVADILRTAQVFCFDVDSTVIAEEGIDRLADFKGVGAQVADLTKKAMGGHVLFQDALTDRLNIIQPSKSDVKTFLEKHPFNFTTGIVDLMATLHEQGKAVYLVSGGFRQMIEPIADELRIPSHRIYANTLRFHPDTGMFAGFDEKEPTSRDGGKARVVELLKHAHGFERIVVIGDGVTDLQAKPPADLFVGFGGVVVRDKVRDNADWFVTDFQNIVSVLKSK